MSNLAQPIQSKSGERVIPGGEILLVLASIGLQLVLGWFFGHAYDIRIFMATGYLVATGRDPYILIDLRSVFNNPAFIGMTSIGYPPPYPLLLGLIYLLFYAPTHNFLLYNLGIKLPVIIANIILAYLVRNILRDQSASLKVQRNAWLFMLFNPFLLYFTTAWGQFDSILALLTLLALLLLSQKKLVLSAVLLSLAIALKPTPVPVVLAAVVYLWEPPWRRLVTFLGTFSITLLALCVLPFFIFGWDASPILNGWNTQFTVSGGMSLTTLYELIAGIYVLPGAWWLLGVVWLPALLIGAALMRRGDHGFIPLLKNSLALILIFFLTRTWLSEQNLALILPIVLILVCLDQLPALMFYAVWVLPLIFTVFNTSPAQLLFPILPGLMDKLLQWADLFRWERLWARMLVVIPWQVAGWWMVVHCLKRERPASA
jgi:Gpi18-like mannosyltransferase